MGPWATTRYAEYGDCRRSYMTSIVDFRRRVPTSRHGRTRHVGGASMGERRMKEARGHLSELVFKSKKTHRATAPSRTAYALAVPQYRLADYIHHTLPYTKPLQWNTGQTLLVTLQRHFSSCDLPHISLFFCPTNLFSLATQFQRMHWRCRDSRLLGPCAPLCSENTAPLTSPDARRAILTFGRQ